MLAFSDFRGGPAGNLCERVGLSLTGVTSWSAFAAHFQQVNKKTEGALVARLMTFPASSGETALIMAILYAADYSRFADELAGGKAWHLLEYAHDDYAAAVASVILRRDRVNT
ncbi:MULTISPECIES: hypothetical protein [Rhizobiaceae]|uniref:hypothetical protein n=1 Tax=Rhizobiaceae TaxID=82115 RepID=UPI000FDA094C|nr:MULTISPECIES: hypothetical protein [Rhizobiaceae]MBY3499348.1 hypothetical protein [Rhizobium laguerreae]RVJ12696.1 hypothetical protein CN181_03575 [Sinorhizobium medicae]